MDAYRHRNTRWRSFEVIIVSGERTYYGRQVEPDRALAEARWKLALHGPADPDDVNDENALARLIGGQALVSHCADGTTVTVAPLTF